MTQLLEKALTEVYKLSPEKQDAIAAIILEELKDEQRWDKAFAESQEMLSKLAAEALAKHRSGQTQELDPDQL